MWVNLKKSVENIISVVSDKKRLEKFSKDRYDEKFPLKDRKLDNGWHHYDGYTIIDENTIIVKFRWGVGDYDYDDSFEVDMTPFYREDKLNNILEKK
jgi:hypothetical protein